MRRAPGIVAILIFISVLLLIDFYVFQGLRTLTSGLENKTRKIISWVYWGINFFLLLWLIWMFLFLFLNSTGGIPKSFSIFFKNYQFRITHFILLRLDFLILQRSTHFLCVLEIFLESIYKNFKVFSGNLKIKILENILKNL